MKLSIIVPVYNTAAYLARCLDSLLPAGGAAAADFELIAVNDGSTDRSREILSDYESRYPECLRVIDTPNGGLGHARNTGIDAAKGEWLLFADSDDWLTEGAVREMLDILDGQTGGEDSTGDELAGNVDIVVFDFRHVDDRGNELAVFRGSEFDACFSYEEKPEFLFSPHNAVNKLWRRELFTDTGIRFPDRLWFEDLATTPRLYLHARRILAVHRAWYCYYQRQGSIMQDASRTARNLEMLTVMDTVLEHYRDMGALECYQPQLEYKFWYEALLASVTRVNRIDPQSPVQAGLRDGYLGRFPNHRMNPYVRAASRRLRLLERAILHGQWRLVRTMISLNNKSKGR